MTKRLAWLALTLLLVALGNQTAWAAPAVEAPLHSAAQNAADVAASPIEIFVITFGPGDHPFSKFGHNAVLVVDPQQRVDQVYNFGTFSANSPSLISDFMQGRLMYWVSVSQKSSTIAAYAGDDRSVVAQRLELTPVEAQRLASRLAHNALPANRYYRYHYYLDNCSTKVRDVLDEALAGALSASKQAPATLSWRQHTSRLTQDSLWVNLGLNLLLAGGVDQRSTRWEEMFLPSVLQDELANARRSNGQPLVQETLVWHASKRPAPATAPARWTHWMFFLGIALGGLLLALAHLGRRSKLAAGVFLGFSAVLGTLAGLLGTIFCLFWGVTDHDLAHGNENLLLFPPWALAIAVAAVACFFAPITWAPRLRLAGLLVAGGSGLGLLLKAHPAFGQDNWMFLALAVPLWGMFGVAAGVFARHGRLDQRKAAAPGAQAELTGSPI